MLWRQRQRRDKLEIKKVTDVSVPDRFEVWATDNEGLMVRAACMCPLATPEVVAFIADLMSLSGEYDGENVQVGPLGSAIRLVNVVELECDDAGRWMPVSLLDIAAHRHHKVGHGCPTAPDGGCDFTREGAAQQVIEFLVSYEDTYSVQVRRMQNALCRPLVDARVVMVDTDAMPKLEVAALLSLSALDELPWHPEVEDDP